MFRLRTARFEAGPTLALIQSDIDQVIVGGPSQREILAIFRGLVDRAARDRPDLIVWPETMFPHPWIEIDPGLKADDFDRQVDAFSPGDDPRQWSRVSGEVRDLLRNWTDHAGVPMLVGINSYLFGPEGLARHNSALLLEPGSEATQTYHKLHLVPFGEYVPLIDTVPAVLALTPFDGEHLPSLDPGPGPAAIRVGPWRFASAICFEDSVPPRRPRPGPTGRPPRRSTRRCSAEPLQRRLVPRHRRPPPPPGQQRPPRRRVADSRRPRRQQPAFPR